MIGKVSWKKQAARSLKIAAAAFAAIALAGEMGLKYSATAGIITILSIQGSKRETLKSAARRWLAFLCALLLAGVCFGLIGYSLWAFGLYLFLFALLCLCAGWGEALAVDSVLITHFLTEQSMEPRLILNEVSLLLIGTGIGILVNLHLHRKRAEFDRLAGEADARMKEILQEMGRWLPEEDKGGADLSLPALDECGTGCFARLRKAIDEAKACAVSNYGNAVLSRSLYELDYIAMRERQSLVLREMRDNILRLPCLPDQAGQVAELIGQIGRDFHKDNTVEGLLGQQEALLGRMKTQPLPRSREEFEARAILFYILMQIRELLLIKREFVLQNGGLNHRDTEEDLL